jgi:hypothetical protein
VPLKAERKLYSASFQWSARSTVINLTNHLWLLEAKHRGQAALDPATILA